MDVLDRIKEQVENNKVIILTTSVNYFLIC